MQALRCVFHSCYLHSRSVGHDKRTGSAAPNLDERTQLWYTRHSAVMSNSLILRG